MVTADYRQITLDLEHEWTAFHRPGAPELYPDKLRDEIEEVAAGIYEDVNNGVYRCGFASTQAAYEEAYGKLFARLDQVSERLATRRYLAGDTITEADIRLWPTLVRFDAVYHGHFKCNRNKITEMPVLWAYARDLYQTPGFGDTIDFAADQGALLPGAHQPEPVEDHPGRARPVRLADPAPPGGTRRPAVRRRNAARPAAARGAGDERTWRLARAGRDQPARGAYGERARV